MAGVAAVTNYRGKRHAFMLRTERPGIAPGQPRTLQASGSCLASRVGMTI
jgi:hypothetical protein